MVKPKKLDNIDLTGLISICQQHLDMYDVIDNYNEDNDDDHYIYEEAMIAIFGKDVFKYINNKTV